MIAAKLSGDFGPGHGLGLNLGEAHENAIKETAQQPSRARELINPGLC
jgi:hypothetical protein